MPNHSTLSQAEIEDYAELNSKQPSPELQHIEQETNASLALPHMMSGGYQVSILQMLIQLHQPKRLLEIGMFSGYSATAFLEVMQKEAKLTTIEHSEDIIQFATPFLTPYIKSQQLRIVHADGKTACEEVLQDEEYDFVFIDANKGAYPFYYDWAIERVPSGGLIILDNMLWKGEVLNPKSNRAKKLHALNQYVAADTRVDCTFLGVRDGLMIARKK